MKKISTCGKWILTGEHTVLRGGKALVFPLASKSVHLVHIPGDQELTLTCGGSFGNEASLIIWDILNRACQWLQISRSVLKGKLEIQCEVPLGAGLGASAALVCAITRWLSTFYPLNDQELFEFSKSVEDVFHGESSGVDIAVSLRGSPLVFQKQKAFTDLKLGWQPTLILTYSGQKGITRESVARVKDLFVREPSLAQSLDLKMKDSVRLATRGLSLSERLSELKRALDLGLECFRGWGLVPAVVEQQMGYLKQAGALAVKPTGSGMGGYVLSLWAQPLEKVMGGLQSRPDLYGTEVIPCLGF
jgi:mevalonate kinase